MIHGQKNIKSNEANSRFSRFCKRAEKKSEFVNIYYITHLRIYIFL